MKNLLIFIFIQLFLASFVFSCSSNKQDSTYYFIGTWTIVNSDIEIEDDSENVLGLYYLIKEKKLKTVEFTENTLSFIDIYGETFSVLSFQIEKIEDESYILYNPKNKGNKIKIVKENNQLIMYGMKSTFHLTKQ